MKKKINILGRKVPILAVMMALLVIGTASAALIEHYAELSGTFEVADTIAVDGNAVGDLVTIDFDTTTGIGAFTINNANTVDDVNVNLVTTLFLDGGAVALTDTRGITITYGVDTEPSQSYELEGDAGIPEQDITVEPGDNIVTVTFGADPALETGLYTIQIAVDPYTAPV